jgi:hypothetical protein
MFNRCARGNGSQQKAFCQYTKGCIFGMKIKMAICTTLVVGLQK